MASEEQQQPAALWVATKTKYERMLGYVKSLQIKDKRYLLAALRTSEPVDVDVFFPAYGLTMGEFCVFQALSEYSRRDKRKANV